MPTDRVLKSVYLGLKIRERERERVSECEVKFMIRLLVPPFVHGVRAGFFPTVQYNSNDVSL